VRLPDTSRKRLAIRPNVHQGACFYDLIDQIAATLNTSVAVCFSELEIPNQVQHAYRTKRPLFLDLSTCRDIAMRLDVPAESIFETTWMYIAKPILTRKKWAAWETPSVALKTYVAAALRFDTTEPKICPMCLAGNKPGRLTWQTGWLFACTRHRVLLVDQCPKCKLPPGQLRRPSRIPKPGQCENHPTHGNPCQQVLAEVSVVRLEKFPDLLHVQNRLEAALCGRVPEFAGQRRIACEYLLDLQDILDLLYLIAAPKTLKQVPVEVRESFDFHHDGRGNGLTNLDFESLETQAAPKANPKTMSTKLFAAHISLALEIADLASAQAVENRLMQLIGLACENEPRFARQILNHIISATRKQRRTQLFLIFRELYHRVKQQYHLYGESKSM
jgi:TniQ